MPRLLLVGEGTTNHCVWRANGPRLVFDSDEACAYFLGLLRKYKDRFGIQILSYCLMGTHPHVMARSTFGQPAFSSFWKVVNWCFARWHNRRTGGRGTVIMERMRSPRIQDARHQLTVMRYIDLNPVKAELVDSPKDWKWSSHRHYAYGEENDLITNAPEYEALGRNAPERRRGYLHLFAQRLVAPFLVTRADLVLAPFIGEASWIAHRRAVAGLSPPS